MVGCLAWSYVRFGAVPQVAALTYAVKPVVIVIIAQGAWRLCKSAVKSIWLAVLGVAAAVAYALGVDALATLIAAGIIAAGAHLVARRSDGGMLPGAWLAGKSAMLGKAVLPVSGILLFAVFLKIGATIFGGGYVLIAFLRSDLVVRLGWLTERQLLDAVAVGQVTPGPLFTTATFVGYLLRGPAGAIVATVAIFLPAFVLVAASAPLVSALRRSIAAGAALDGINVAALGLMIVVSGQLARAAILDRFTLIVAALSAVLLFRFRINSSWLILGGAVAGLLLHWMGK
jgi:chromate transporter